MCGHLSPETGDKAGARKTQRKGAMVPGHPMDALTEIAGRLETAARTATPVAPVADDLPERSVSAAYRVQEINTRHALDRGRRLIGRKIGLTSAAVQNQLGVDQPDYGMLFADMEIVNGGKIAPGLLIAPKVEAEIAFILKHGLDHTGIGLGDVLDAIDWVAPALEIVDSRIAGWAISIYDTIADNASSGRFVLGETARRLDGLDLRLCGMVLEHNGIPASLGVGAACLGHPLNAVRWLAEIMVRSGRPLGAGDIILSGALGPMVAASPGDGFSAQIGGLGMVSVGFAPSA